MIRTLKASTALLALMTAGAFGVANAQTESAEQPAIVQPDAAATPAPDATTAPDDAAATADQGAATTDTAASEPDATLTPEEPTIATAFIGRNVFSSEDPESDNIGEVNDLIIGNDGMITHAVVGVGGFLGLGEKDVAVPFDELQVVEDEDGEIRLIYAATKEQLEAAEAFDRTAYDPQERAQEEQQAAADAASTDVDASAPAPAPMDQTAEAPAADAPAADGAADSGAFPTAQQSTDGPAEGATDEAATDMAAAPAEDPAATDPAAPAADDTAAADAPAADEPATDEPSDMAAAPAAETDATTEAPADQMAAETPAADAPATDAAPADQMAAETATDAPAAEEPAAEMAAADTAGEAGFLSFGADQVRASDVIGKEIFGPDDASIGEVSDLVMQDDGATRAALIDVGGFLGVGEKEVAIPFEQIELAQDGDEPRLTIAMTREELEGLPAYEDRTMGSEDTAATDQPAATDPAADPNAAPVQDVATTGQNATGAATDFQTATQDLSADELIGTAVYSPDETSIGEVGDVVFDQAGAIEAVVIDVGGFLGVGEKPVAVQFDALNVQKDVNGDVRLMVNATQDQLEQAPAYQEAPAQ